MALEECFLASTCDVPIDLDTRFASFPVRGCKKVNSNLYAFHGTVEALSRHGNGNRDCVDDSLCQLEQVNFLLGL